jgi:prephenate dehydrogenase
MNVAPAKDSAAIPFERMTIIGLGLMGGSMALALRGKVPHMTAVDVDPVTLGAATELIGMDAATPDLAEGVAGADVVVLATPVRVILEMLEKIGPHLKPGATVIDLGSTKSAICAAMGDLPEAVGAMGGHPMCGRARGGLLAAARLLYNGAPFVLCETARTTQEAFERARWLVDAVGARPVPIAPDRHDRAVAAISHLPYLVSAALVGAADAEGKRDDLLWELAASGFRDTSRLAGSEIPMILDILITNRPNVIDMIRTFRGQLAALEEILAAGDEATLRKALIEIQSARRAWERDHYRGG